MRLYPLLVVVVFLAACTVRDRVDFVPEPAPDTARVGVLVATTRQTDPELDAPGFRRSESVAFGRYVVSIPPDREPGEIPRPRARQPADPRRHFMLAQARDLTAGQFRDDVRAALQALPPTNREAVIFVHGFNNTFVEGLFRTAQLGHDLRLSGVLMHYSWPSMGAPLAYAYDRDSVLFARDGLVEMLRQVRAAGPRRIILMAHSMGSLLVMEALRQLALTHDPALSAVGGVALMSPDIDVDVFRRQVQAIGELPQPFLIVTSQRDRILRLSARLTGETARLGNLANAEPVAGLGVTMIDVSAFSEGAGHFTVGSSPSLIGLLDQINFANAVLARDVSGSLPLLPATILTLQNTTQVILQPMTETRRRRILPPWFALAQ